MIHKCFHIASADICKQSQHMGIKHFRTRLKLKLVKNENKKMILTYFIWAVSSSCFWWWLVIFSAEDRLELRLELFLNEEVPVKEVTFITCCIRFSCDCVEEQGNSCVYFNITRTISLMLQTPVLQVNSLVLFVFLSWIKFSLRTQIKLVKLFPRMM